MTSQRTLRVLSITPQHPGGSRQPGEESHVRMTIDLGLKGGVTGVVIMDEAEAVEFAGEAAISAARVHRANRSYAKNDRAEWLDLLNQPHDRRGCITREAHDDDGCTFPTYSRAGALSKVMKVGG